MMKKNCKNCEHYLIDEEGFGWCLLSCERHTDNYDCDSYFHTREESDAMAEKIRKVLKGADVIEMPTYEKEVINSEEIYRQKGYDKGEYCHEQSFLWGFQEGIEWLKSKIIK